MKIQYNEKIINISEKQKVIDIFAEEIKKNHIIACRFNNEVKSLDYEISKDR